MAVLRALLLLSTVVAGIKLAKDEYNIGWISALPIELAAAQLILEEQHETPDFRTSSPDDNAYVFGRIGKHNVIIACLPSGRYGLVSAATVANGMHSTFPSIQFGLMVGIGGGAPSEVNDIRLGDVIVGIPTGSSSGIVQYDFGKTEAGGIFVRGGSLDGPPPIVLTALTQLRAMHPKTLGNKIFDLTQEVSTNDDRFVYPGSNEDRLFSARYNHPKGRQHTTCSEVCKSSELVRRPIRKHEFPHVHYGVIASANQVMKDGATRDEIAKQTGALCFEMEAAGLMNIFRTLVVRGVCDYADSHKNKEWQPYASITAAAFAKELLSFIDPNALFSELRHYKKQQNKLEINFSVPFTLPFRRNNHFLGRESVVTAVHQYLTRKTKYTEIFSPSIFVLIGAGGMGKTQTAVEYAYRYHSSYSAVFWINANTESDMRSSILKIMQTIIDQQAKISFPGVAPDCEIIGKLLKVSELAHDCIVKVADTEINRHKELRIAFFSWLATSTDPWLLIYDNADDLESFDFDDYLPSTGQGSIVVTSRRQEFSADSEQYFLGGLEPEFATELLLRHASRRDLEVTDVTKNESSILVHELGLMPLAIVQAGTFVAQERIQISEYMKFYTNAFMETQSRRALSGWQYRKDTIATTWEVSFRAIEQRDSAAARMLLVCSYLNPIEIQEFLWIYPDGDIQTELSVKRKIALLASYSLVDRLNQAAFRIHPVVHSWARERGTKIEHLQVLKESTETIGDWGNRTNLLNITAMERVQNMTAVTPHLEFISVHLKPQLTQLLSLYDGDADVDASPRDLILIVLLLVARVFGDLGKSVDAQFWYDVAFSKKKIILGNDRLSEILLFTMIGHGYVRCLEPYKALKRYRTALFGYQKINGWRNARVLSLAKAVGVILHCQGRFSEALELERKALDGFRDLVLAGEVDLSQHEYTRSIALTLGNIATRLLHLGRYDEALTQFAKAHELHVSSYGSYSRDANSVAYWIGLAQQNLGQNASEVWFSLAYKGFLMDRGAGDPLTWYPLTFLGLTRERQGLYGRAEKVYKFALDRFQKIGTDQTDLLFFTLPFKLGYVCERQGKYQEALSYYFRCLRNFEQSDSRVKSLQAFHCKVWNSVGRIFYILGHYSLGYSFYQKSLLLQIENLGERHPVTLLTMRDMGAVLVGASQYSNRSLPDCPEFGLWEGIKMIQDSRYPICERVMCSRPRSYNLTYDMSSCS